MKQIGVKDGKNYYEVLGVAPHVGGGQIQAAYRFARSLYSADALASYGLLDAEERTQMLALVEEAYAALSNSNERRDHDLRLVSSVKVASVAADAQAKAPEKRKAAGVASPLPLPPPVATPKTPDSTVAPLRVPEVVNGAALRTLREARSLSVDQIAALSKVGTRFLIALEQDRYHLLPARVFARGFLTEYARAIRVSETELVERYMRHWPAG